MPFLPFLRNESGAVTVDWVVLTAAVVALALTSAVVVSSGAEELADDISSSLSGAHVAGVGAEDDAPMWGYDWAYDWGDDTTTHAHWREVYLPPLTDAQLLGEFETMISEGHEGLGASMDMAYFTLVEMERRGLATDAHVEQLQTARATFA